MGSFTKLAVSFALVVAAVMGASAVLTGQREFAAACAYTMALSDSGLAAATEACAQ